MTWLTAIAWVKDHWKELGAGLIVLLILLVGKLWTDLGTTQGKLEQCQAERAAAEQRVEVSAITLTELEAKLKANFHGSVDLEVEPGAPVAGSQCPPCPKIKLKADCGGGSDATAGSASKTTATASVIEKPGPGVTPKGAPAWALSLGGGIEGYPPAAYHGSVALDYHALRAYGTYDTNSQWTAGAQVKVLTWDWP